MPVKDLYDIRWCCAEITTCCSQMSRFYFDRCTDADNAIVITYNNDGRKRCALRSFADSGNVDTLIIEPDQESELIVGNIVSELILGKTADEFMQTGPETFRAKYQRSHSEGRLELIFYRSGIINVIPNYSAAPDLTTVLGRLKITG